MEAVIGAVTDGLSILGAVVSVYLSIGIGVAFLEGQIDTMTRAGPLLGTSCGASRCSSCV